MRYTVKFICAVREMDVQCLCRDRRASNIPNSTDVHDDGTHVCKFLSQHLTRVSPQREYLMLPFVKLSVVALTS